MPKVLSSDDVYVSIDDGRKLQYNEVAWIYRSGCCGSAIERHGDDLVCKWCENVVTDLVHKNMVQSEMNAIKRGLDALPDNVRAAAIDGYYASLSRGLDDPELFSRVVAARVTHIVDYGSGDKLYELPEKLRRK